VWTGCRFECGGEGIPARSAAMETSSYSPELVKRLKEEYAATFFSLWVLSGFL
jgi:hypothetical protein